MSELELLLPEIKTSGNLASMQLPDVGDYNYWNFFNNRIICIDGELEDWDYNVVKSIIQFNFADNGIPKEERKPIILLIDSNGGLLTTMFSIIDAVACSITPVWTVNMGEALSAASLIFLAGERRFATKNSWCMTHPGSGGISGNFNETQEQQKVWKEQVENMGAYIVARTGLDEKVWKKYKNKDWWLNSNQQIEFGFATEILENINDLWRG